MCAPDSTAFEITGVPDYHTSDLIGVPNSKTFDVTLMVYLIKTLTSTRPINGFYSLPSHKETTPGSDLARIKWYRQKLLHHDSDRIDTAWFNSAWRDLSGVSVILSSFVPRK